MLCTTRAIASGMWSSTICPRKQENALLEMLFELKGQLVYSLSTEAQNKWGKTPASISYGKHSTRLYKLMVVLRRTAVITKMYDIMSLNSDCSPQSHSLIPRELVKRAHQVSALPRCCPKQKGHGEANSFHYGKLS